MIVVCSSQMVCLWWKVCKSREGKMRPCEADVRVRAVREKVLLALASRVVTCVVDTNINTTQPHHHPETPPTAPTEHQKGLEHMHHGLKGDASDGSFDEALVFGAPTACQRTTRVFGDRMEELQQQVARQPSPLLAIGISSRTHCSNVLNPSFYPSIHHIYVSSMYLSIHSSTTTSHHTTPRRSTSHHTTLHHVAAHHTTPHHTTSQHRPLRQGASRDCRATFLMNSSREKQWWARRMQAKVAKESWMLLMLKSPTCSGQRGGRKR